MAKKASVKDKTLAAPRLKSSSLLDTRVVYCGDNLEQLAKLPDACVDLIYIDPPFNSNRNYEVFWGETKEKRAFEDRHENTKAYAQAHEGICVGYDTTKRPFWVTQKVKYQNPETPFDVIAAFESDPTEIYANITCRKSSEWDFEEEYRIAPNLGDIRQIPFEASAIKEIRFGARIKTEFKEKVMDAVSHLPHRPTLIQMGCDFDRFILTESAI